MRDRDGRRLQVYLHSHPASSQCAETLKKEFIGPGLHLRPVHADHARPPPQGTLNSVFSVYEKTTTEG